MTTVTEESRVIGKLLRTLCEDLNCGFVVTEISDSPAEPDQIISAWVGLGVLACFGEFCFEVAPRFSCERRCDLFGALEACLRKYGRAEKSKAKNKSKHAALSALWLIFLKTQFSAGRQRRAAHTVRSEMTSKTRT